MTNFDEFMEILDETEEEKTSKIEHLKVCYNSRLRESEIFLGVKMPSEVKRLRMIKINALIF